MTDNYEAWVWSTDHGVTLRKLEDAVWKNDALTVRQLIQDATFPHKAIPKKIVSELLIRIAQRDEEIERNYSADRSNYKYVERAEAAAELLKSPTIDVNWENQSALRMAMWHGNAKIADLILARNEINLNATYPGLMIPSLAVDAENVKNLNEDNETARKIIARKILNDPRLDKTAHMKDIWRITKETGYRSLPPVRRLIKMAVDRLKLKIGCG